MIYRREIDGLRAVAVVPVILFHAGVGLFSGGYVGVDIFFVISGYLITSILIDELEKGDFSILRFYERRARRILPALFFVMLCCVPFALMWMMPSQLSDFSQSIAAVTLFVSNILFWSQEGYFAPAAELKPLLHTWSLAVEEQYYLVFPVFLMLLWRFGRTRVFWMVAAVALVSLVASEWGWRHKPSANFYLAPTRAWELLAGSLCAFWLVGRAQRTNNWLSLLGLLMILYAIFRYDDLTPFPSVYALVPVMGAALIILFGGKGTWTAQLLEHRSFVGIGLISYSAYLWHQPLFAFARIRSSVAPAPSLLLALALLSLVLAYFSWRYIETPFRKGRSTILPTRRAVFAARGMMGSGLLAIGLTGCLSGGLPSRFSQPVQRFARATTDVPSSECYFEFVKREYSRPEAQCMRPANGKIDVMLIGDSHMWVLTDVLRQELDRRRQGYYIVSHASCLPFSGTKVFEGATEFDCQRFVSESFNWAATHGVKTVVIAARFSNYLRGARFDNGEGGVESGPCEFVDLRTHGRTRCTDLERRKRVLALYETRIRELAKSFNIVLVYPIPEAGWDVPIYGFKKAYFRGDATSLTTSYPLYRSRTKEVRQLFDRLSADLSNVYPARAYTELCDERSLRCLNADRNGVYYYDDDHLTNTGARLVAPVIIAAVMKANARTR